MNFIRAVLPHVLLLDTHTQTCIFIFVENLLTYLVI